VLGQDEDKSPACRAAALGLNKAHKLLGGARALLAVVAKLLRCPNIAEVDTSCSSMTSL